MPTYLDYAGWWMLACEETFDGIVGAISEAYWAYEWEQTKRRLKL